MLDSQFTANVIYNINQIYTFSWYLKINYSKTHMVETYTSNRQYSTKTKACCSPTR